MQWRPQDVVAVILAVGVMALLISGTELRCMWMDCSVSVFSDLSDREAELEAQFWQNVMNTLIGGIIGYVAGRHKND